MIEVFGQCKLLGVEYGFSWTQTSRQSASIRRRHKIPSAVIRKSSVSKSGLGGRAELSAFFMEDLLVPQKQSGTIE
jgi:hypothetical protein